MLRSPIELATLLGRSGPVCKLPSGSPETVNCGSYWHPDGKHIIFSSKMRNPEGRNFNLFIIDIETPETQSITHCDSFDGFLRFVHDSRRLVFDSNRFGKVRGEANVLIADWES